VALEEHPQDLTLPVDKEVTCGALVFPQSHLHKTFPPLPFNLSITVSFPNFIPVCTDSLNLTIWYNHSGV